MEYLAGQRDREGVTHLSLRVPLDGVPYSVSLQRYVTATVRIDRDDGNLNDVIRIAWEPEGGGLYPSFDGTLTVWSDAGPEKTYVELEGTYKPPLGLLGQAFDSILGRAIARRTARALLLDIARRIAN